jgi:hypothetical protein
VLTLIALPFRIAWFFVKLPFKILGLFLGASDSAAPALSESPEPPADPSQADPQLQQPSLAQLQAQQQAIAMQAQLQAAQHNTAMQIINNMGGSDTTYDHYDQDNNYLGRW